MKTKDIRKSINIIKSLKNNLNVGIGNKTQFTEVPLDVFDLMKTHRYSDKDNMEHMAVFRGKDNKEYLIVKSIDRDTFRVYNLGEIKNAITNNEQYRPNYIAIANFDVNRKEHYFSGYESDESIMVDEKYRRLGIASAITDFAENFYEMTYKPSDILSAKMQGFVKNRFN